MALCAITLAGCAQTAPVEYQPITVSQNSEQIERDSKPLLAEWVKCRMEATRSIALTTTIPSSQVPGRAFAMCRKEREAWVKIQATSPTMRGYAEQAANSSENCSFDLMLGYAEMIRRGASKEDLQIWLLSQQRPVCAGG